MTGAQKSAATRRAAAEEGRAFAHGDRSQLPLDARARLADDELGVWGAAVPGRARTIVGDD